MIKTGLVLEIIILFIISLITPIIPGCTNDVSDVNISTADYGSYNISEIYEPKRVNPVEYSTEQFKDKSSVIETRKEDPSSPIRSASGPMDSAWPMYCHDASHTGRSPYDISGNALYEKWKVDLHEGSEESYKVVQSSPVIDNEGKIYVGVCGPGSDGTLHAINPDGSKKWEFKIEHENPGEIWYIDSTPGIDEDSTIYVGAHNGVLYAINPDGTLKWENQLKDHWLHNTIFSSLSIADDGTIYTGGYENLYAVNPEDGSVKWYFTTGMPIASTPAIGSDGTIYVASHDGTLYALNPDGTLKWDFYIGGYIYSSPAIGADGTVYIGIEYSDLCAISSNGELKWKFDGLGAYHAVGGPSIGFDGTIYYEGSGTLYAVKPDGTEKWSLWMGYEICSPIIAKNGNIYISGGQAGLGSPTNYVNMVSSTGERIYSLRLRGKSPSDNCHLSSPAFGADGTVYIGSWFYTGSPSYGYLHAIGTKQSTENKPPHKPHLIGPPNGKINNEYSFYTSAVDPEAGPIYFWFDWGDGIDGEWLGPYESIVSTDICHSWTEQGSYQVKVKARDQYDAESEWSDIENISISKSKNINMFLFNLLEILQVIVLQIAEMKAI